jgi:DNA-binding transcriptional ArsR family regulator
MVNYIAVGAHCAETSKSSMRWYRLKCIYLQIFYSKSRPFEANQLLREANEDGLFIRRFLRKSTEAGRFMETSEGWVPTVSATRRAEAMFETSGLDAEDSNTYFNFSLPSHYHVFSISYSTLVLRVDPRATVLGMAIEWALWEAELAGNCGLTANKLSSRLDVTKSSLSAAILKLYQAHVVREIPDPIDGRAKIVSLWSGHPLYPLKRRLVEEMLQSATRSNLS